MKLPGKEGEFELTDELIRGLELRHHGKNVRDELYKMNLWLHRRPAQRPKRMLTFIDRWLDKVPASTPKLHIVAGKMSEADLLALGRKHGTEPRPGESWEQFGRRLRSLAA